MTTYDGNELRERLREKLVERWNYAADTGRQELETKLRDALKIGYLQDDDVMINVPVPRADEPWVAELIAARALALEERVTRLELDAQIALVLT